MIPALFHGLVGNSYLCKGISLWQVTCLYIKELCCLSSMEFDSHSTFFLQSSLAKSYQSQPDSLPLKGCVYCYLLHAVEAV